MSKGMPAAGQAIALLTHLALVGGLAPACSMFTPTADGAGARLDSTAAVVHFSGVVPLPGLEVTLEARRADGTFVEFARARAAASPSPELAGSYAWSVDAAVARAGETFWAPFDPVCKLSTAHVRATTRLPRTREATPLLTYTDAQLACLQAELRGGRGALDAHLACGASSEGVDVVAGPRGVLRGAVVANTPAEAAALRCVERIEGNLTIGAGCVAAELPCPPERHTLSLPRLREVTGNLSLTFGIVERGAPVRAATIDLPALARVGGAVTLVGEGVSIGSGSLSLDLGLPALAAVGGTLTIDVRQFNTYPSGLAALTELPADLVLDFRAGDAFGGMLPQLGRVRGNLVLRSRSTTGVRLPRLAEVDGDVVLGLARSLDGTFGAVGPFISEDALTALTRVHGSFSCQVRGLDRGALARLARVDGALRFERPVADRPCGAAGRAGPLGAAGLTAGVLTIEGCAFDALPVPASLRLDLMGPLRAASNPNLCTSTLDGFVDMLRGAGWRGEATLLDNGPC